MQTGRRLFFVAAFACWLDARAAEPVPPAPSDLQMSADLRKLFQQEMIELLSGTQKIAVSLPVGNWKDISETSAAMWHSYVLEKQLTPQQKDEISRLPEEFKALDEAFHVRARKLEGAASARDARSVALQFSRLLETCTTCHAKFARTRFPSFTTQQSNTSPR